MAKTEICSPLPSVFYRSPSPGEPNCKEVGDTVVVGDVLGLVEVMKTITKVTSDVVGTIISFPTDNEDAVMPGQVLVEIED